MTIHMQQQGRPACAWAPKHGPARCTHPGFHVLSTRARCQATSTAQATLNKDLKELDAQLAMGEEPAALATISRLVADGTLKGFGKARQVPKRIYTIEDLRLNKIDAAKLLSPEDKSLNAVRNAAQAAAVAGLLSYSASVGFEGGGKVLGLLFALVFTFVADQVANQGGGEALVTDSLARVFVRDYARRVARHEAGHLLVAYLMGLLPRLYTLSAWDAFARFRTLNLQAGTQFCDAAFRAEVASGKLTAGSLDVYVCVALAGVVSEALCFGQAEGGVGDVAQLDGLLRACGFTQKKADAEVRWAVLNVAEILRRHADTHAALADAMDTGKSVGECIALIEARLAASTDV